MQLSSRTLQSLGWPQLLAQLAQRCHTEPGKRRALSRPLLDEKAQLDEEFGLVAEARELLRAGAELSLSGLSISQESLTSAEKGALLEPRELLAIADVLVLFGRVRAEMAQRGAALFQMSAIAQAIPELGRKAQRIARCIGRDGQILDDASPEISRSRARLSGLHRSMKERLDGLLSSEAFQLNLRERYYSVRNGRYVVPVLASHRAEVPGIVHNASQSGQTLFVEPEAIIGLGNDLAIAQSILTDEERILLQELTDDIGRSAAAIAEGIAACARLDEAQAAARLADEWRCEKPQLCAASQGFSLKHVRHPLLLAQGKRVVGNDVALLPPASALVLSGPNAGGKTVTLTAVGLCALMARAGLPIPAEVGSTIPLFSSVHAALGDAQDLFSGLSTFSAHLAQIREILEEAQADSLVLVDEIAADTDPREGAALASSVAFELIERGAHLVVTTHLQELKALGHLDPRFLNARVGFDLAQMAPTYRLQLGESGSSSALEIAEKMGLPERVCQRAKELMGGAHGPLAQALLSLESEQQKLQSAQERLATERAEAQSLREALAREKQEAEKRHAEEESRHQQAMAEALSRVHTELKEMVAHLRMQASLEKALSAERDVKERIVKIEDEALQARVQKTRVENPLPSEPKSGDVLFHVGLQKEVEVLEVAGDEALVGAGSLKMRVPLNELSGRRKDRAKSQRQAQARPRGPSASAVEDLAGRFRCDVRGQMADDAVREVEQFLDRLFRGGELSAMIIHGHGTGALRHKIRQYLSTSPYVRLYRPGEGAEGGDGVTVVSLHES